MDILALKTVLVAEDDDFMRRVLVTALTRMGGRVIESSNGQQALAVLNEPNRVDVAILDVMMPQVHGMFVLQQIRAGLTNQDFEMPVMLLTATRDEATVHYAAGLSCDGFLVKPINQTDLADRLSKVFTRRMALPYKPPHYRKIDVGPPDQPLVMPTTKTTGLTVSNLRVGMVFAAPVKGKGKVIVPEGMAVTTELLTLLRDLEKVVLIEPMSIKPREPATAE